MSQKLKLEQKKSISVILVEPENSDNIGSVSRAMKNMGFNHLVLVSPPEDWKQKGKKMAVSASDTLEKAKEYASFRESIKGLSMLIATTRRTRRHNANWIPFETAIEKITGASHQKPVGIVFGKESKGLDNPTINECDWVTTIPTGPAYPSINLAQAVMIFVFSIHARIVGGKKDRSYNTHVKKQVAQVSKEEIYEILERIRVSLSHLGYDRKRSDIPQRIIATFYGLFKRAGLVRSEANMLKGLTRRIIEKNKI